MWTVGEWKGGAESLRGGGFATPQAFAGAGQRIGKVISYGCEAPHYHAVLRTVGQAWAMRLPGMAGSAGRKGMGADVGVG